MVEHIAFEDPNKEERANFREQMSRLDANLLVFLDECGSNIALIPRYDRARHPDNAPKTACRATAGIILPDGGLLIGGNRRVLIIEGAANAATFEAYIEHVVVPSLQAGQIVVMDNLQVYKGARVRQWIENKGHELLFFPAYSPDLSPIEEIFSKLKAYLRCAQARTREALQEAIIEALLTVTPQDAHGWFGHRGYASVEERKS